jgi:hypothetical protein
MYVRNVETKKILAVSLKNAQAVRLRIHTRRKKISKLKETVPSGN